VSSTPHYDVVIVGAGLAGLSLTRHLLLETDKRVLLLEKRDDPPGPQQKVGESLVQLAGYYFSKTLDLEEYLFREHYLKYNLRFYWTTAGRENNGFEDYSKAFSRKISDIATFQLDRNRLERDLLVLNQGDERCEFVGGVKSLDAELGDGEHTVRWEGGDARCTWLVDTSGRSGFLKKKLDLRESNPIRHGSTFCWVDGLVDIEKLTDRSWRETRLDPARRKAGNFPAFLATNHFCAEGMWFWVIPLHEKTSLGLVYEHAVLDPGEVSTAEKMLEYVCRKWPLFARDLPQRKVVDEGRYVDFSYAAKQTISARRWGCAGEAGRFSDPLYSPGSDLISIYNTLLVDAIETDDAAQLAEKCEAYELAMRVVYEAYVPSYAVSYNCLGDPEVFSLKYSWELAIYFGFYVFPFVNEFPTVPELRAHWLRKFGLLGTINRRLQDFLSAYFHWKKTNGVETPEPRLIEFYDFAPLSDSEKLFYDVGGSVEQRMDSLDRQYDRMKEFARLIAAHVHAAVIGDRKALLNADFVRGIKLRGLSFEPEAMHAEYARHAECETSYDWNLEPFVLDAFLDDAERASRPSAVVR